MEAISNKQIYKVNPVLDWEYTDEIFSLGI